MAQATRQDVISFYRFYLGREPESQKAVDAKVGLDIQKLRMMFLNSQEYKYKLENYKADVIIFGNCQAAVYEEIINSVSLVNCQSMFVDSTLADLLAEGNNYIAGLINNAKFVCFLTGYEHLADTLQKRIGLTGC